jgi:hypothetical protein
VFSIWVFGDSPDPNDRNAHLTTTVLATEHRVRLGGDSGVGLVIQVPQGCLDLLSLGYIHVLFKHN